MVRALTRRYSTHNSGSFRIMSMLDSPGKHHHQKDLIPGANDHANHVDYNLPEKTIDHQHIGDCWPGTPLERPPTEMDMMKEKFAKLLLGEDMSGGGKGVSSALALSNAVTNLAASVFGEQVKLGPMAPETKARWRREMDWLLSVTDHIVEFVPSQQKTKNGTNMEIMVTRQRSDLLVNIPGLRKLDTMLIETLDNFGEEQDFWYASKNDDQENENGHRGGKWWHPTVKNGRSSLGDSIYKGITVDHFDPLQFLATMDLSTEHKVLEFKNRIEASVIIWKRKLQHKDGRSSWGSGVSLEKREVFEERAEIILILLKQLFPGLPQSALDISKIQYNRDVGHAILESYSRILESLAFNVMLRIEDVLHADCLTQTSSPERFEGSSSSTDEDTITTSATGGPTLSDFMGWAVAPRRRNSTDLEIYFKGDSDKKTSKPNSKKSHYLEKLENSGLRSHSPHD